MFASLQMKTSEALRLFFSVWLMFWQHQYSQSWMDSN